MSLHSFSLISLIYLTISSIRIAVGLFAETLLLNYHQLRCIDVPSGRPRYFRDCGATPDLNTILEKCLAPSKAPLSTWHLVLLSTCTRGRWGLKWISDAIYKQELPRPYFPVCIVSKGISPTTLFLTAERCKPLATQLLCPWKVLRRAAFLCSTHYANHTYSLRVPLRKCKLHSSNFPRTAALWNGLPRRCFPDP